MAYVSYALAPRAMAFTGTAPAPHKTGVAKPSFFSRLIAAMMDSRRRAAERDIARYLGSIGGKFTDEAEREIERRFLSNQSRW